MFTKHCFLVDLLESIWYGFVVQIYFQLKLLLLRYSFQIVLISFCVHRRIPHMEVSHQTFKGASFSLYIDYFLIQLLTLILKRLANISRPLVARARAHRMFPMSCWKVSFHVDYHILRRKPRMKEGGLTPNQLHNKLAKAQKMRKLRVNKARAQNIFIDFLTELDHSKTKFVGHFL